MPTSDILRICSSVAAIQLLCNVACHCLVFKSQNYKNALYRLDRATKAKQNSNGETTKKGQKAEKIIKRAKRVEDDHQTDLFKVAGMHLIPNIVTGLVFLVILRIFSAEMNGSIVGLLPFAPFALLRRFTGRGLNFANVLLSDDTTIKVVNVDQACSFMFIYFLSTLSIKFYVNKIFDVTKPPGVEGFANFVEKANAVVESDISSVKKLA